MVSSLSTGPATSAPRCGWGPAHQTAVSELTRAPHGIYAKAMKIQSIAINACPLVLALACGGQPTAAAPVAAPPQPVASAAVTPPPPAAASATAAPTPTPAPAPAALKPVVRFTEGLSTPESVLYDAAADRYLVSNINGGPAEVDNNGYIAELSPDGKVIQGKFIAGGVKNVKLDAPKGLGLVKGTLYVADISVVRKFDAKTGAPQGEIKIPNSTFLNDIAISSNNTIFVSDSGLKPGKDGLEPNGTDAVYAIEKGKVRTLAKSKDLFNPNGLLSLGQDLIVVTFGSDEAYKLDDKGVKSGATKLPAGGLDGVVALGDELLISSWKSSSVYRGKLGGKFEVVAPELKAPADIGYDTKRKRLLVPHFMDNSVEVFDLP